MKRLLILVFLSCAIFASSSFLVRAEENLPYTVTALAGSQRINAQLQNGELFLFLPAFADCSALELSGNVILNDNIFLTSSFCSVNLEACLNERIIPGREYSVAVTSPDGQILPFLHILQADKLPTIFAELNSSISHLHKSRSNTASGSLLMADENGNAVNKNTALSKFKGRGNSSWFESGEKRSYGFTLQQECELIAGAGSAENWCLITDNCHGSWVHEGSIYANAAAYDMYNALGGSYAIMYDFVNLYINGKYRGIYLLTEKVEIHPERVNISSFTYSYEDKENSTLIISSEGVNNPPLLWDNVNTENAVFSSDDPLIQKGIQAYQYADKSVPSQRAGGFLLEIDRNFYSEPAYFITKCGIPYVVKEPEYPSGKQLHLIASYVQAFEDALVSPTGFNSENKYYSEYIDTTSMAKKLIIDLFTGQCDVFVASCFFSCELNENGLTKLFAGPAWDYDGSEYNSYSLMYNANPSKEMVGHLLKHGDFHEQFTQISENVFKPIYDNEKFLLSGYNKRLLSSHSLNSRIWDHDTSNPRPADFDGFMRQFFQRCRFWESRFFGKDKTLGITITAKDNVLIANKTGSVLSLLWKKLEGGVLVDIPDVSGETFTPFEEGVYYCIAEAICEDSLNISHMYSNPITIEAGTAYVKSDGIYFTHFTDNAVSCFVAEYNQHGALVSVRTQSHDHISFTPNEDYTYKAFVLTSDGRLCHYKTRR